MAIGFCKSGSAAKTVALHPAGNCNFARASSADIGWADSGSELYGVGKSEPLSASMVPRKRNRCFVIPDWNAGQYDELNATARANLTPGSLFPAAVGAP